MINEHQTYDVGYRIDVKLIHAGHRTPSGCPSVVHSIAGNPPPFGRKRVAEIRVQGIVYQPDGRLHDSDPVLR